ncbi:MAG: polysaccharide biosynthesis protein [Planctomycetota bacterium]|jgi:O-antigen/teichoic acid export membrane protein
MAAADADAGTHLRRLRSGVLLLVPSLTAAAILQALFLKDQAAALSADSFAALAAALSVQGAAALVLQLSLARTAALNPGRSVSGVARRAGLWGASAGAALLVAAWPAQEWLSLPAVLPLVLAGPLLAIYAPFAVLLGGLQGRQRFGWFGALVVAEAGCRWPAAVLLRRAGVEGASAAMVGLLACYAGLAVVAAAAVRRGALDAGAGTTGTRAAGPGAGFVWSVAVVVTALGAMTYADFFAVQGFEPGALGGSAYGAAASLGRAAPMVLLPFTVALFPGVIAARAAGQPTRPLLMRALTVGGGAVAGVSVVIALAAAPLVELLFPHYPEAVRLIQLFPLASAPVGIAGVLAVYGLATDRPVAWVVGPGCLVQWGLYAWCDGAPFAVLTALGATGCAVALALAALIAFVRPKN